MNVEKTGTWWFDITTLEKTFGRPGRRATGIPRVMIEFLAAARLDKGKLHKIRLAAYDNRLPGLREVGWIELDRLLLQATRPSPKLPTLAEIAGKMPFDMADRLHNLRQFKAKLRERVARVMRRADRGKGLSREEYLHPFCDGDIWINLGCWWHSDVHEVLRSIRRGTAVTTVVLIHDCMPLIFPEYFPRDQVQDWARGIETLAQGTDLFLVGSENTGNDLVSVTPSVPANITRIRFGDGFDAASSDVAQRDATLRKFGIEEPYVLVVGTIEIRKNHMLAFRAWRTMLRKHGERIPSLIFAGKWGWKVEDLRALIRDSAALGGKLEVVEAPSDSEMRALYDGALLTLFPSFYEGWGLPVRESLAHGKICVAARNSSIPEAGGELADYFESDCQTSLVAELERHLLDEPHRQSREAEIRDGFRAVEWRESWNWLATTLGELEIAGR